MDFLWFSLIGIVSGIFAGMGMGGGTFLIPLLTILMGVSQQIAQGINLIVFIPLSVVVLIIYHKKKLLKLKDIWWLLIPAIIVSGVGSLFAIKVQGKVLQIIFGVFLILVGLFMVVTTIISQIKAKRGKN